MKLIRHSIYICLSGIGLFITFNRCAENTTPMKANRIVTLQNERLQLRFDLTGGALTTLILDEYGVNPYDWRIPSEKMPENNRKGSPFQGHFFCSGRWGAPTPDEIKAGIPHNGEFANGDWTYEEKSKQNGIMYAEATIEKWKIEREINLSVADPVCRIDETVTNLMPFARHYVIVQHATFGGRFLNNQCKVHTNAGAGFNQALIKQPDWQKYTYTFPRGIADTSGNVFDLTLSDTPQSYVSTHIVEDTTAWITIASPMHRLLVGYVWKQTDYPWVHIWHDTKNGTITAKGLEFGTTGLGDTFPMNENLCFTFKNTPNLFIVDANEKIVRSYYLFALLIPETFQQVDQVIRTNDVIQIRIRTKEGETTNHILQIP